MTEGLKKLSKEGLTNIELRAFCREIIAHNGRTAAELAFTLKHLYGRDISPRRISLVLRNSESFINRKIRKKGMSQYRYLEWNII